MSIKFESEVRLAKIVSLKLVELFEAYIYDIMIFTSPAVFNVTEIVLSTVDESIRCNFNCVTFKLKL